jgi:DNA-binding NtrC family response regulator
VHARSPSSRPWEKRTPERELLERARVEKWDLGRLEREYILDVLESCHGHRGHAAEVLGIDRRTLYRKLKEYQQQGADLDLDLAAVE